jgi:hypothetical protein
VARDPDGAAASARKSPRRFAGFAGRAILSRCMFVVTRHHALTVWNTSMPIIRADSTRARRTAAVALCILPLLAACGDGRRQGPRASADTTAAAADTSAMGIARRALGEEVRMAVGFRIPRRSPRFVAAALPIMEWVPDVARSGNSVGPGGHELVIVEFTPESHAVHKPGLYASREPFLPRLDDTATAAPADSATLSRMMGVDDADGDGAPEVWAAQYRAGRDGGGHTWDVRAYDRNSRTMYQLVATARQGAGIDASAHSFSGTVAENPPVRQWLTAKVQQLEAALPSAPAGGGR